MLRPPWTAAPLGRRAGSWARPVVGRGEGSGALRDTALSLSPEPQLTHRPLGQGPWRAPGRRPGSASHRTLCGESPARLTAGGAGPLTTALPSRDKSPVRLTAGGAGPLTTALTSRDNSLGLRAARLLRPYQRPERVMAKGRERQSPVRDPGGTAWEGSRVHLRGPVPSSLYVLDTLVSCRRLRKS